MPTVTWTGTREEWDAIIELVDRGIEDWEYISGLNRGDYDPEDIVAGNRRTELAGAAIKRAVDSDA